VNVWNVDNRGTLTPSRQYRKKSQITVIVFCVIPPKMEAMKRLDWKKTYSPPFFFGTDKGSIIYADDLGHCTEVQMLNSSIDKMLFFEENSRLVIITKSLLLSQYQVADDGRVTKIMQMKLSVEKSAADLGLRSAVWAGPGLLALGTCEKMVRFFDFQGDENYNLSLQLVGDIVDRNDRVFCVAFSPIDRYLAVGTQTGILVIWRYSARVNLRSNEKSSGITAADWEVN
jgi:intraflagellar transport protein 140